MKNLKKYIINNYHIGLSTCFLILYKFGFLYNKNYKYINNITLIKNIEKNILFFFKKRERLVQIRYSNIMKKIINGSYYGYKRVRGLPMYGQRTKTNNRTSRKKLV